MDRLLWLLSSTVALVSTKYILVDLNYHYPIFLTLLQLTAALAVWPFAVRYPLIRDLNWPTSFWNSSLRTTLSPAHGVAALALGSSLPLYAQAALHFQNLPTLAMLSVTSLLAIAKQCADITAGHCLLRRAFNVTRILIMFWDSFCAHANCSTPHVLHSHSHRRIQT